MKTTSGRRAGLRRFLTLISSLVLSSWSAAADTAPSRWSEAQAMPQGHAFPTESALQIGRKLYLVAGGGYRVGHVLAYDVDQGTWTSTASALLTNRHHFATAMLDGKLYVAGGCLGDTDAVPHRRTNAVERWDPATGHWTPLSSLLTARQAFLLVPYEGKLFAIGGADREGAPVTTVEVYDPAKDEWLVAAKAPWPQSLAFAQGVVDHGKAYVVGSTKAGTQFYVYDLAANSFTALPAGRIGERQNTSLVLAGGEILVVGGSHKQPVADVTAYDIERGTWRDLPPLPAARAGVATACVDGRVYCIGGWGPEFDWAHPNASVFVLPVSADSQTLQR
jgi:N-acetylneuraminic acid mutarotase